MRRVVILFATILACGLVHAAADPEDQCVNTDPIDACNRVAAETCFFDWELDVSTSDLSKHGSHHDGMIECDFYCNIWGIAVPEAGSCTVGGGIDPPACHVGFLDCTQCPEEPVCIAVCALNPLLPWC